MINVSDPFLRKLVEDALRGGNTSLGQDLEPGMPSILRRPMPAAPPMTIPDTNPLPGGTPPPRGPQPSILQRMLSGIYVPPAPSMHGYEKNRASRMFLSGLTGAIAKNHGGAGYGSGILGAVGGRNGGGGGGITPYQQETLNRRDRDFDANQAYREKALGNTNFDNEMQQKRFDLAMEKWAEAKRDGDENAARLWAVLAETIKRDRDSSARGWANVGMARERLGLSKQTEARRAQLTNAMLKWTPLMLHEYATKERMINNLYDEGVITGGEYEQRLNGLMGDYEERNRGMKTPFGSTEEGNPRVISGSSVPPTKENAAKLPQKKGFLEGLFAPKQNKPDPAGIR